MQQASLPLLQHGEIEVGGQSSGHQVRGLGQNIGRMTKSEVRLQSRVEVRGRIRGQERAQVKWFGQHTDEFRSNGYIRDQIKGQSKGSDHKSGQISGQRVVR